MKSMKVLYIMPFVFALANTSPIPTNKTEVRLAEDVPKGKSLVLAEPLYGDQVPVYQDPIMNYYDSVTDDDIGKHSMVIYPTSDMEVAESNIVFRPLFAYRKQMEKRRRIYLQSKSDTSSNTPRRRGYYYYYGYPLYYQNREFQHVS